MAERRGHPWAAVLIGLVTVVAVLGGGLLVAFGISWGEADSSIPTPAGTWIALRTWVVLGLVGGLVLAWLVGSGRVLPRRAWAPTHQVPAEGMKAWGQQDLSGESIDLPEHLPLRLDEVRGTWAMVSGSNGATGWVEAGLLVPLPTPFPEPPAPEAGGHEGGP
jgi:hypothetical protein